MISRFSLYLPRASCLGAVAFLLTAACSSSDKEAASSADLAAQCGADWKAECKAQNCDPTDAAWSDCKINGWASYVAPPLCPANSGQKGDDAALCAPAPDVGMQLHFGPSSYDDADEVAKYMLPVNAETYDCTFAQTPSGTGLYVGQYIERSRPGAHHVQLSYAADGDTTPAGTSRPCNLMVDLLQTAPTFMAIAQQAALDVPSLATARPAGAADDGGLDFEGSAAPVDPNRMMQVLSHYLNTTDQPILKEAWFNLYFKKTDEVKSALYGISLLGNQIKLPPHATTTVRRSVQTDVDRNIKYLQGHSHVGSERVSMWHATGSTLDKIYESYDPLEPANIAFNPYVTNAAPNADSHSPGGASGPLLIKAGDSIVWECSLDNQTDATIGDGDPNPSAFGQMCYVYGSYAVPIGQTGSIWVAGASTSTL